LRSQLKTETSSSKKALRDTEGALAEASALSQRRDREYTVIRDSVRGLTDGFKADHAALREEMRTREERVRKEADELGRRYRALLEETRAAEDARREAREARTEEADLVQKIEEAWRDELRDLRAEVERSSAEGAAATTLAKYVCSALLHSVCSRRGSSLATELARLRRLMQGAGRDASDAS
jgi:chromosome segregation ATPase